MDRSTTNPRPRSALREFLTGEAGGGVLLILAAVAAMILANSGWADAYRHLLHTPTGPTLSDKLGPMTAHLWINDGLMAVFFLLVGLEIKREFLDGRLASWPRRRLPMIAAISGMALPALIFLAVTGGDPALQNGWAIPAATDIAFAIGVLALLGRRAPTSLKLLLVTVAIVDDMGAVAIIALVYTAGLKSLFLGAGLMVMGAMYVLNRSKVLVLWPYILGFVLLWYCVLMSGVHATVAGVLAAMMIPIVKTPGHPDSAISPVHRLEHAIQPWCSYLIVPLFGFANAGVSLSGLGLDAVFAPLPLGIAAGLVLGKQLGIFGAIWLTVRLGWAQRPRGSTWLQVWGLSLLCGIGFTMSLFIGALAFPAAMPVLIEEAKIGVLMGSVVAAVLGFAVLRLVPLHPHHEAIEAEDDGAGSQEQEALRAL